MRTPRTLTAVLLAGGLLLVPAGAAQAGESAPVANPDVATWDRASLTDCLEVDVLANDVGDVRWVDTPTMAGGGKVIASVVSIDHRDRIKLCPGTGLRTGDVVVVGYASVSVEMDSSISTLTVTVAGMSAPVVEKRITVQVGVSVTTEVAPGGTPEVIDISAGDPEVMAAMGAKIEYGARGITVSPSSTLSGDQVIDYALADGTHGSLIVTIGQLVKAKPQAVTITAGIASAFVPVAGEPVLRMWTDDPSGTTMLNAITDPVDPPALSFSPMEWIADVVELSYATANTAGVVTVTVVDAATAAAAADSAPAVGKQAGPSTILIAGATAGLMLLLGGGAFLVIRRRQHRSIVG